MKQLKELLKKHLNIAAENYQNNKLPEEGWDDNQVEELIKEINLLKLEDNYTFPEKALEIYGYTPKDLDCANAETALSELFDTFHNNNLVSFLDSFISGLTVEDLIKLKQLTNK